MRIALVNDLPLAVEALRRSVARMPGMTVAWTAADGVEALEHCHRDRPDLILMDLIMPRMDGVECTRRIMHECPCPILVVTATVSGNAARVYDALGAGALDAIDTPNLGSEEGMDRLGRRISHIERLTRQDRQSARKGSTAVPAPGTRSGGLAPALIGASTGGPQALCAMLREWPRPLAFPAVIVQHLDPTFIPGLAEWLSRETGHRVQVAEPGGMPESGTVWLAGGSKHLTLDAGGRFRERAHAAGELHHPSVDALFESAAASGLRPAIAALLTGMGSDGAQGLLALRRAGWQTVAQDQATSVVWGMPGSAVRLDAATRTLPLPLIGVAILAHFLELNPTRP